MFITLPPITSIIQTGETAENYKLSECYPNPFNSQTVISFNVPKTDRININIYDVKGRKIKKLVSDIKTKGEYRIVWNTGNLASGIYYINFKSEEYSKTIKALLIK